MKKQLSNEELVEQIRSGRKVSENMETLYKNNLPLIRQFIRPFIYFEPEQDLTFTLLFLQIYVFHT